MRIIAEGTIRQWAGDHARAAVSLRKWVKVVRPIRWRSFAELRRTFPSADLVTVKSGRKVAGFNVGAAGLIYICNPNNPTGNPNAASDIEWLVANKPAGSVVMIDEAYTHIAGAPFHSDM